MGYIIYAITFSNDKEQNTNTCCNTDDKTLCWGKKPDAMTAHCV